MSPSARRKRLYLSLDIERLLAHEGIDSNMLMPRHPDPHNPQTIEQGHDPLFPIYLPLKVSIVSVEGCRSGVEDCRSLAEESDPRGDPIATIILTYQHNWSHRQGFWASSAGAGGAQKP